MADPCLGCGTTVDAATQQLTIKGANSKAWSTDYGDSTTASGLYCDPNTGNLWTPPAAKYGTIGAPSPTSWAAMASGLGDMSTDWYAAFTATGNVPVDILTVYPVATSGFASLVNTTNEPLVVKVRAGGRFGVLNVGAGDVRSGLRAFVRYYSVAGGSYTETAKDVYVSANAGNRIVSWAEREVGTWTVSEGGGISVHYQAWCKAVGIYSLGTAPLTNQSGWGETFANLTYNTARPV